MRSRGLHAGVKEVVQGLGEEEEKNKLKKNNSSSNNNRDLNDCNGSDNKPLTFCVN